MKSSGLAGGKEPSQPPQGCSCFHLHVTHAPPRCDARFPASPHERQQVRSRGRQSRAAAPGPAAAAGCPCAIGPSRPSPAAPGRSLTKVAASWGFSIRWAQFNTQLPLPASRFPPPASKIPHRGTHWQLERVSHGRARRWTARGVGGRRMGLSYPYSSI